MVIVKAEGSEGHWKVVRRDDFTTLPGEIVTADEDTGYCVMTVPGPKDSEGKVTTQTVEYTLGPNAIKLVRKGR